MGERKVLNRYVPPDFDASIIPKFKRPKNNRLMEIRMMLPFSMCCNTCGEYMYAGTKFNSKKEDAVGEDYMGIKRFRFYIKCTVCNSEITFKTDPKNTDYEMESGASRNFELWRDVQEATEEVVKVREEEDEFDTMKALENRTLDSKIEIDVLDALDEIKAINQRHERVDTSKVLEALDRKRKNAAAVPGGDTTTTAVGAVGADGLTAADEELVKSIKFKSAAANKTNGSNSSSSSSNSGSSSGNVSAAVFSSASDVAALLRQQLQAKGETENGAKPKPATALEGRPASAASKPPVIIKRRRNEKATSGADSSNSSSSSSSGNSSSSSSGSSSSSKGSGGINTNEQSAVGGGLGMLAAYGDDDSD